jgi:predicted alpha/beta superfamily hydrolase
MKKAFIPIFLSMLICIQLAAQQQVVKTKEILFQVTSPSLPDDSAVYICGNLPQLSNWNPSVLKMKNNGNHVWSFTIKTDATFPIEYKFTLGSWSREGAGVNGRPLSNFIIRISSDTVIKDIVPSWLKGEKRIISGKITGSVKYHQGIKKEGIPDRDLIVWLPPDYEKNTTARYRVLYMQDGQNIVDPNTSSFGNDWQIDETCDSLIRNNIIDPLIVVGIYNTRVRSSEYSPGKLGTLYMDLVVNTIKPLIDSIYRTLPDSQHTFVGGSSSGGTISFMLVWHFPDVFSKALCFSPALKLGNLDLVKEVSEYTGAKKDITWYFDNGGKGLEERLQPGIDDMIKVLEEKGFVKGKDLFWVKAPEAEHNEVAWAKRMPGALIIMAKGGKDKIK